MTNMSPQEKFNLGAKWKKAGLITALAGLLALAAGGGMFCHGQRLQMQAQSEARAQGYGTLTVTPAPKAPLGGKAGGKGDGK